MPAYGDRRRSFCGDQCAKRAARKKRGPGNDRKRACRAGVYYEPVNRIKVFDRDGWCCQVCGARAPVGHRVRASGDFAATIEYEHMKRDLLPSFLVLAADDQVGTASRRLLLTTLATSSLLHVVACT